MNTPAIDSADSLADAAIAILQMRLAVGFALDDLENASGVTSPVLDALIEESRAASAVIARLRRERDAQRNTHQVEPIQ